MLEKLFTRFQQLLTIATQYLTGYSSKLFHLMKYKANTVLVTHNAIINAFHMSEAFFSMFQQFPIYLTKTRF